MELRHLRCFIATAEELSLGRAAHRLHVSQPAALQPVHVSGRLRVRMDDGGEAEFDPGKVSLFPPRARRTRRWRRAGGSNRYDWNWDVPKTKLNP